VQTDAVLDAWKSAGLKPEHFAPVQPPPYAASYCEGGDVAGIDTLVCEYGDDGAPRSRPAAAQGRVGALPASTRG
jgi:hypothetical protein